MSTTNQENTLIHYNNPELTSLTCGIDMNAAPK